MLCGVKQNVPTLHTNARILLSGGKSPGYSKGHGKCKQITWSIQNMTFGSY